MVARFAGPVSWLNHLSIYKRVIVMLLTDHDQCVSGTRRRSSLMPYTLLIRDTCPCRRDGESHCVRTSASIVCNDLLHLRTAAPCERTESLARHSKTCQRRQDAGDSYVTSAMGISLHQVAKCVRRSHVARNIAVREEASAGHLRWPRTRDASRTMSSKPLATTPGNRGCAVVSRLGIREGHTAVPR